VVQDVVIMVDVETEEDEVTQEVAEVMEEAEVVVVHEVDRASLETRSGRLRHALRIVSSSIVEDGPKAGLLNGATS